MPDEGTAGRLRDALLEQRGHLRREIQEQGADPDSNGVAFRDDPGFSDRSHSTEERSRLIAVVGSLRANLQEVDRALAKIDAGTFGTCERCGGPIADERLEAIPWATLCIGCKQRGLGA